MISSARLLLVTSAGGCIEHELMRCSPCNHRRRSRVIKLQMYDKDVRDLLEKRRYLQAFERLFDLYGNKVYRMALLFLKDPGRAEESTQDIFLKLWRVLPAYDGRASPGTWLYTIARNTCLSASRAEAYRATAPLDPSNEPAVPNTIVRDFELGQCLDRLTDVQREVIMLFYLQEKSIQDVAEMLNLPEGTVKSHLYRARVALAAMLKE